MAREQKANLPVFADSAGRNTSLGCPIRKKPNNNYYFSRNIKEVPVKFNTDSIVRSTYRLAVAAKKLQETQDPAVFEFIKKESGYLLRRSIALWFRLRFGRQKHDIIPRGDLFVYRCRRQSFGLPETTSLLPTCKGREICCGSHFSHRSYVLSTILFKTSLRGLEID